MENSQPPHRRKSRTRSINYNEDAAFRSLFSGQTGVILASDGNCDNCDTGPRAHKKRPPRLRQSHFTADCVMMDVNGGTAENAVLNSDSSDNHDVVKHEEEDDDNDDGEWTMDNNGRRKRKRHEAAATNESLIENVYQSIMRTDHFNGVMSRVRQINTQRQGMLSAGCVLAVEVREEHLDDLLLEGQQKSASIMAGKHVQIPTASDTKAQLQYGGQSGQNGASQCDKRRQLPNATTEARWDLQSRFARQSYRSLENPFMKEWHYPMVMRERPEAHSQGIAMQRAGTSSLTSLLLVSSAYQEVPSDIQYLRHPQPPSSGHVLQSQSSIHNPHRGNQHPLILSGKIQQSRQNFDPTYTSDSLALQNLTPQTLSKLELLSRILQQRDVRPQVSQPQRQNINKEDVLSLPQYYDHSRVRKSSHSPPMPNGYMSKSFPIASTASKSIVVSQPFSVHSKNHHVSHSNNSVRSQNVCYICKQSISRNQLYFACDSCGVWIHHDCSINIGIINYACQVCPFCTHKQISHSVPLRNLDSRTNIHGILPPSMAVQPVSHESTAGPPPITEPRQQIVEKGKALRESHPCDNGMRHTIHPCQEELLEMNHEQESSWLDAVAESDNAADIELDNLSEYQSLIERKLQKRESKPLSREVAIHRRHCHLENATEEHIINSLGRSVNTHTIQKYKNGTYINCDLRYFNLSSIGKFDVVLIDPPWRVGGSQRQYERSNMFSNNSFKLQYNTLSYEEIIDIDVQSLSDGGFLFLWVLNSSLQFGLACMNKWGYSYVDKIVWVKKSKRDDTAIQVTHGYYFLHSTEICLVGVKYPKGKKGSNRLQYISKISNDILFHRVGSQSQKPESLYEVIEAMAPGARRVELFARNNNIREGWLSLGNRLGPEFDRDWKICVVCSMCKSKIKAGSGKKRYKHRRRQHSDICEECLNKNDLSERDYFALDNSIHEAVYHDWYACDNCHQNPICGTRFTCTECDEYDLCEPCFDQVILSPTTSLSGPFSQPPASGNDQMEMHGAENRHVCLNKKYEAIEITDPGMGFPVHHGIRCNGCLTCPIIGERFHCRECSSPVNLCRNCFFKQKEPRQHRSSHKMDLIPEPVREDSQFKCVNCKTKWPGPFFMCRTCFMLVLCANCHEIHDQLIPIEKYLTHKHFHTFTRLK